MKDMELENTRRTISIPKSAHIDDLTIQLLLIGSAYLMTYLLIWGLSAVLTSLGSFGETVSEMLWGFNFVIGTVVALVARIFIDKLRLKGLSVITMLITTCFREFHQQLSTL